MADLRERAFAIIARQKDVDPKTLTMETPLESLGITSFEALNVAFDLEEEFGVSIPDESIASVQTVGDIVEQLEAANPSDA